MMKQVSHCGHLIDHPLYSMYSLLMTDTDDHDYLYLDKTVEVSVEWLLKNTNESCDFGPMRTTSDWLGMIASKSGDTGFGHLVESIMARGFMEGSSIGWYDGGITEGHHRLAAAILLCLDTVPISRWGSESRPNGERLSAHWHEVPYPIMVD